MGGCRATVSCRCHLPLRLSSMRGDGNGLWSCQTGRLHKSAAEVIGRAPSPRPPSTLLRGRDTDGSSSAMPAGAISQRTTSKSEARKLSRPRRICAGKARILHLIRPIGHRNEKAQQIRGNSPGAGYCRGSAHRIRHHTAHRPKGYGAGAGAGCAQAPSGIRHRGNSQKHRRKSFRCPMCRIKCRIRAFPVQILRTRLRRPRTQNWKAKGSMSYEVAWALMTKGGIYRLRSRSDHSRNFPIRREKASAAISSAFTAFSSRRAYVLPHIPRGF